MIKKEKYSLLFMIASLIIAFLILPLTGGSDEGAAYIIWIMVPLLFYFTMKRRGLNVIKEMGILRSNLKKGVLVSIICGVIFGFLRYILSVYSPLAGIESYYKFISWIPENLGLAFLCIICMLPVLFIPILIEQLFYNSVLQSQIQKYTNHYVSIILTAAAFGLLHIFTPLIPDFGYGFITFIMGIIHAYLFYRYKNILAPTIFLTVHLMILMFLLII